MRGLQESWDAYLRVPLDASARQEKLEHLERFLRVVLRCAALSADELHFGDMRSVSNILAGEFLVDVHRICSESPDEDVSVLKGYLLLGRGGVILRVLNTIGVEQLSCSKELGDLLMTLLPLCLKFPKSTNGPDSLKDVQFTNMDVCFAHLPFVAQSPASRKIKFPVLTEVPTRFRPSLSGPSTRWPVQSARAVSRSTSHGRTSVQAHGARGDPSSSLSDSDDEQVPPTPTFHSTKHKRTFTAPVLMRSAHLNMGVYPGLLKATSEEGASSDEEDEPPCPPLEPMELGLLLLTVLRDLCFDDMQSHVGNDSSVSVAILPLLAQLLLSLEGEIEGLGGSDNHGWEPEDFRLLQRYGVRVLMTMAAQVSLQSHGITLLHSNGALNDLFNLAWALVHSVILEQLADANAATQEVMSKLLLAHDVLHGCWLLLIAVFGSIPLNPSVLNTSLKLFHDVLQMRGLELMEALLLRLELITGDQRGQLARDGLCCLLSSLANVITCMKKAKVDYMHMIKCTKQRHQRCDYSHYHHHHHDILGLTLPEEVATSDTYSVVEMTGLPENAQPCGVAVICQFLFLLQHRATSKTLKLRILGCLEEGGACCCVVPAHVLQLLLENFTEQPHAVRSFTLSVLMKTLLQQCGGSDSVEDLLLIQSNVCPICQEDDSSTSSLDESLTNGIDTLDGQLFSSEATVQDDANDPRWRCLRQLQPLVLASDEQISAQVISYALRLVSNGCSALRQELFLCVFLPIFQATHNLQAAESSTPSLHVVLSCLSALPILLQSKPACKLFLNVGGVQQLGQLVGSDSLRSCVLRVFQVLIILEERQELALPLHTTSSHLTTDSESPPKGSSLCLREYLFMFFDHLGVNPRRTNGANTDSSTSPLHPRSTEELTRDLKSSQQALAKYCDLWDTTNQLFTQSKNFSLHFIHTEGLRLCRQTMEIALTSLIQCEHGDFSLTLLFSRDRSTELGCWLALLQATLSLALSCATCMDEHDLHEEESVSIRGVVDDVTERLIASRLVRHAESNCLLKLVCDMLFQTATRHRSASDVVVTHTFTLLHLRGEDLPYDRDVQELSDPSSSRDTETCVTEQGYEADSEVTTDFTEDLGRGPKGRRKLVTKKQPLRKNLHNTILYPELCRLALVLIIKYKQFVPVISNENAVVLHVLLRLLSLAKSSDENSSALYSQHLIGVLLSGFKPTLASKEIEHQVEKRLVLSIFETISRQQFSARELHQFLNLFKEENCCYDGLLSSLINMSQQFKCQPGHFVKFPIKAMHTISDFEISVRSLEDDVLVASFRQVSLSNGSSRRVPSIESTSSGAPTTEGHTVEPITESVGAITAQSMKGSSAKSPANLAPLQVAMRESTLWPTNQRGFSICFWLLIEGPSPTRGSLDEKLTPFSQMLAENTADHSPGTGRSGLPAKLKATLRRTLANCHWSDNCLHLVSVGNQELMLEVWTDPEIPNLIFRLVTHSKGEEKVLNEVSVATRLLHDTWQHLSIAYNERLKEGRNNALITTIVDGCFQKETTLDYSMNHVVMRQPSPESQLFLGHAVKDRSSTTSWQLGNLMLFRDCKLSKHASFHIYALGPDCLSLTQADCSELPAEYCHLITEDLVQHSGISHDIFTGSHAIYMQHLRDNLVLVYHPKDASSFHMYHPFRSQPSHKSIPSVKENSGLISHANPSIPALPLLRQPTSVSATSKLMSIEVDCFTQHGLATAIDENGGIEVFLFLFAKVVDNCTFERYQAEALQLLLTLMQREPRHAHNFNAMSGYAMLAKVLRSKRCMLGYQMLKVLLDACLTQPILLQRRGIPSQQSPSSPPSSPPTGSTYNILPEMTPGHVYLDKNSTALIRNVKLITDVLLSWRSWENAEADVKELLFSALETLVRPQHPQQHFNVRQLQQANVVRALINICLERIQDSCPPLSLPISSSLVAIIQQLVGRPPDLHAVILLCDFLLLMHPAASTYVSHSANDLYFSHKWAQATAEGSRRSSQFSVSSSDPRISTERNPSTSSPVSRNRSHTDVKRMSSSSEVSVRRTKSLTDISDKTDRVSSLFFEDPIEQPLHSLRRTQSFPLMGKTSENQSPLNTSLMFSDTLLNESSASQSGTPLLPELCLNDELPSAEEAPSLPISLGANLEPNPNAPGSSDDWVMHSDATSMKNVKGRDLWGANGAPDEDGNDEGTVTLSVGVLDLLTSLVGKLKTKDLSTLHGIVLQWERLVILVHHPAAPVRAAVIRLLDVFLHQASSDQINSLLRHECFHLLAAQLHRHFATLDIVDACLTMLMGRPQFLDEDLQIQLLTEVTPTQLQMVVPLLALLSPSLHDLALCHNLLGALASLFNQVASLAKAMITHGLVEALCNLLHELIAMPPSFTDLGHNEKFILYFDIQSFFRNIGQRLFSTSGVTSWQHFEETFSLLIALEYRQARSYGNGSSESCHVREVICIFLQSTLEHVSDRLDTPANLQQRTTSTISSAVGSLLQWRSSPHDSTEDLSTSQPHRLTVASQEIPLTNMSTSSSGFVEREEDSSPAPSRLFKSRSGTGIPDASAYINFPNFRRSVSATIGEYSRRAAGAFGSGSWVAGSGEVSAEVNHADVCATGFASFVGKKDSSLSQTELLERFKKIITLATDFVLYEGRLRRDEEDPNSDSSTNEESQSLLRENVLERTLLQFLMKSLLNSMEKGFFQRKTLSTAVMWQAKDVLKVQFSRMLVHQLAPDQIFTQRSHALNLVANEPKMEALLKFTMNVNQAGQKVVYFLYELTTQHTSMLTRGQRNEANDVLNVLQLCGYPPLKIGTNISEEFRNQMDEDYLIWTRMHATETSKWLQRQQNNKFRVMQRNQPLMKRVSENAMLVTQQVNNTQSQQRKVFLDHVKRVMSEGLQAKKHWQTLIQQLAHERGIWHCPSSHPPSWQLDPTEGPSRVRKRLQRCHLSILPRFLRPEMQQHLEPGDVIPPLAYIFDDHDLGSDSAALIYKLHTSQNIQFTCMCSNVTPSSETPGALLIGDSDLYFVADDAIKDGNYIQVLLGNCDMLFMTLAHEDIKEIHKRWYQLRDHGLEIFLTNGKTCLLAFDLTKERNELYSQLLALELPNLLPSENLTAVMQLWLEGHMTNFDYLTYLNKVAGRTFNDLMQYPVFPFILANYDQAVLDLNNPDSFRNLAKPISVQHKDREERYQENYEWLVIEQKRNELMPDPNDYRPEPYHYGSHYSNSGTVLHFLVRLPPFTQMFLKYQDNNFDIPDRTFHSVHTAWHLASYQSTTDVKELIPEFFFFPEFLRNGEGFAFGNRQDGQMVDHVDLTPWCSGDARLFTLILLQALESDYVSQHLPAWIDLVFGCKQTGKEAIEAFNVFHPATYFGVDVDSIKDPLRRSAMKTMIKTYGQTPKQLFRSPHPPPGPWLKSKDRFRVDRPMEPLESVVGLSWGHYIGSPDQPEPISEIVQSHGTTVSSLISLPTGELFGLGPKSCLMVKYSKEKGLVSVRSVDVEWAAIMSWGHADAVLRVRNKRDLPLVNFLHWGSPDEVRCCASVPDCRLLFFGCSSGAITVIHIKCNSNKQCHLQAFGREQLFGHNEAVTSILVCKPFSIIVSASDDGSCIIWDLNRLIYVRSISDHKSAVTAVAVSDTSGDIASVSHFERGSTLKLHTVNAQLVVSMESSDLIHCLAFSHAPEGRSVNVLAGGLSSGVVRLWNAWDLSPVRDITFDYERHPMISLCFSHDSRKMFAADAGGRVIVWMHPNQKATKVAYEPFL